MSAEFGRDQRKIILVVIALVGGANAPLALAMTDVSPVTILMIQPPVLPI